jgi:predicted regulator of Ras-like GTPase activity (Roadblock/LC7/MglB family)
MPVTRSHQLGDVLADLLAQTPHLEAAAVVSFDGLPMASALPVGMDEDRVAAMSAALLSLGERAAEGLGRGGLSQVYIDGADGTVFLVSADGEAVLVGVATRRAKSGLVLYELRRAAESVARVLRQNAPVVDPYAAVDEPVEGFRLPVRADLVSADGLAVPAPVATEADFAALADPLSDRLPVQPAASWSTVLPGGQRGAAADWS